MQGDSPDIYEGLSLPQLLDLMHEIVLPAPPSISPQTPGWWILLSAAVLISLCAIEKAFRYRRKNSYRKRALAELNELELAIHDDSYAAGPVLAALLKRTALEAWPRETVAALHGEDWAVFLSRSAKEDPLVARTARQIVKAAYDPSIDVRPLLEGARRWIRLHRV
ncbi:MAG: DUF4381 domain-containing protein [Pseudomonadota bacterium]